MTRMRVKGLTSIPGERSALAVLETLAGDRRLGLVVPLDEANRLARALGLAGCGCTPIYELIGDLLGLLEAGVAGAVLDAHPEGIGAAITLARSGEHVSIPCHPADALALAVRARAPIHATDEALARACPVSAHAEPGDPLDGTGAARGDGQAGSGGGEAGPRGDMCAHGDGCADGAREPAGAPDGALAPAPGEVERWLARVRPADFAPGDTPS